MQSALPESGRNGPRSRKGKSMHEENSEAIRHLNTLDTLISEVASVGYKDTVALLKIARLDLAMRAHGIADPELAMVLSMAELNAANTTTTAAHVRTKRGALRQVSSQAAE